MPLANDLSSVADTEIVTIGWDFSELLQAEETIVSVVTSCALRSGTDDNAEACLMNVPEVSSSNPAVVLQQFGGAETGSTYLLEATASTSFNQVFSIWMHIKCIPVT